MDALQPLLELTCVRARPRHQGLSLDFGGLVEYDHPRLQGEFHGLWEVWTDTCTWRLYEDRQLIAGERDEEPTQLAAFERLAGRRLLAIEPAATSADALLRFSAGLRLEFFAISTSEVSWEAAGSGLYISFGPGAKRAISTGDEPGPGLTVQERLLCAHAERCAERWQSLIPPEATDARRCRDCAYYLSLRVLWHLTDYGLCTNPASEFDGRVARCSSVCPRHAEQLEAPAPTPDADDPEASR